MGTATLVLPPLSGLYSLATRLRLAAYRRKLFSVTKLDVPVISVGNITTGGTGKTPLVEWACRVLAGEGRRVCVLSRGYGRENPDEQVVVSDGRQILHDVSATGDEPLLLATKLLGIAAVVCNAKRSEAAKWAIDNLRSDVFVLDDGFQHLQLARDLNIVTIDAANPWGGGMLPYGHLREPLSGLSRADCILFTRTETETDLTEPVAAIREFAPTVPIFKSRMVTSGLRLLNQRNAHAELPSGPIAAFCGIGNPEAFFTQLRRAGYDLVWKRSFRDHYDYRQTDIDQIAIESANRGAKALVTTAKDAVKLSSLKFDLPCYVLEIKIAIENEQEFIDLLRGVLENARHSC